MGEVFNNGGKENYLKVNGKMAKCMEKVFLYGKTESSISACKNTTRKKDLENIFGIKIDTLKVIGETASNMEMT